MKGGSASGGLPPAAIVEGAGLGALIAYGHQHGNTVTYDEINEFMPFEIQTSDQIDIWLRALDAAGVAYVEQR